MSLLDEVRTILSDSAMPSFRLVGEDLIVLGPDRLRHAADDYDRELARTVPPSLRGALVEEQSAILHEAHTFITRHNTGIHERVRGYVKLARRVELEYPWPVVAILGILEVKRTLSRVHLFGWLGLGAERLGFAKLTRAAERMDDVLRRTNRSIFADSVPTVLYALRCHALAQEGRRELSDVLLSGPVPVWMDAESKSLAGALVTGLAIQDPERRFAALAELTLRHFGREQAILSHHMGVRPGQPPQQQKASLLGRAFEARSVLAPRIRNGKLVLEPYPLPPGFDIRDHDARVRVLGDAFVRSVTRRPEDYRAAAAGVLEMFG